MKKSKAYLHEDIIGKILIRMPTKPLVRLKCVSKQWNRLISDPNFMKSRSRRMIFLPGLPLHALDINVDGEPLMIKLKFPFYRVRYEKITLVGSFNGIVLLVLYYSFTDLHDVILYSPFSGEYKKLLDPRPISSDYYVYGFGYGTSANDLKIVKIQKHSYRGASHSFETYSLKTWSWSKHPNLIGDYTIRSDSGTFANGFLYWISQNQNGPWTEFILVLNIKTMVFSEIRSESHLTRVLGTYNGQLCIFYRHSCKFELRIMNEHGLVESRSTACSLNSFPRMFNMRDDGKVLMLKPGKLVVYDMFKDSYKEMNTLESFKQVERLQSIDYVESMISISDICSHIEDSEMKE